MAKKKKNTDPVDVLINYVSKKRRKGNQKIESLWDPYRDGITYSLLSKFMGCRERTRLSYVEGWISKNFSVPLEFGNLFHLLKEVRYSGASMKASLKSSEKYIQSKIKKNDLIILTRLIKCNLREIF